MTTIKFDSIADARTNMINDGLFEAANLEREDEIVEFMYRNDCDLESALNSLNAWL